MPELPALAFGAGSSTLLTAVHAPNSPEGRQPKARRTRPGAVSGQHRPHWQHQPKRHHPPHDYRRASMADLELTHIRMFAEDGDPGCLP